MSARRQGLRVCCPTKPDWGVGHVLSDDGGAKVTVFFPGGGKRTLNTLIAELDVVTSNAAINPILDVAAQANWQHAHHNLYVVELRPEIFERERRFFEKNPHWLPGKRRASAVVGPADTPHQGPYSSLAKAFRMGPSVHELVTQGIL